eukprot:2372310-Prymnesium_polylepis.1
MRYDALAMLALPLALLTIVECKTVADGLRVQTELNIKPILLPADKANEMAVVTAVADSVNAAAPEAENLEVSFWWVLRGRWRGGHSWWGRARTPGGEERDRDGGKERRSGDKDAMRLGPQNDTWIEAMSWDGE